MEMLEQGMRDVRGQEMQLGEALYEVLSPDVYVFKYLISHLNNHKQGAAQSCNKLRSKWGQLV